MTKIISGDEIMKNIGLEIPGVFSVVARKRNLSQCWSVDWSVWQPTRLGRLCRHKMATLAEVIQSRDPPLFTVAVRAMKVVFREHHYLYTWIYWERNKQ